MTNTNLLSDLIDMRNMEFEMLKDLDYTSLQTTAFTKAAKVNSGFVK